MTKKTESFTPRLPKIVPNLKLGEDHGTVRFPYKSPQETRRATHRSAKTRLNKRKAFLSKLLKGTKSYSALNPTSEIERWQISRFYVERKQKL